MKSRVLILSICAFILLSAKAGAKDTVDLGKEADIKKQLHIYDYQFVKTLDFGDLGDNTAYTLLYRDKDDKNPRGYYVAIESGAEGASLFLNASEPCKKGATNNDDAIEVDGTNIQVVSVCGADAKNNLVMGYKIKTAEGNSYVIKRFTENSVVIVRFRSMKIPFEADDFSDIWRHANKKAV